MVMLITVDAFVLKIYDKLIIRCHTTIMTSKEERYFSIILEDIHSKFDLLIELVQHVNNTKANQTDVLRLEKRMHSLEQLMNTARSNHTRRISKLEKSLKPS